MRPSFALKIGFAISALSVGLTSASVYYFYANTKDLILIQMGNQLKDIGRTGSFLLGDRKFKNPNPKS